MSAGDDNLGLQRPRAFAPYLAPGERLQLNKFIDFAITPLPEFADQLRGLARQYVDDGDSLKLRAICLLVADLYEQGWQISSRGERITFDPPGLARAQSETIDDIKQRVRQALQSARRRQLSEPSVKAFLDRTEKRRMRGTTRASILDLIDNGADLAQRLRAINAGPEADRESALAQLIDPVVEVCEAGARCPDTHLLLNDIWRYFRHTWAHEYRAIPGRQMLVLIRNAARPHRPVMGIAMLSSPVMRLSARDNWIGWLRESAQQRVEQGIWPAAAFAEGLISRLEASIADLRWDDLASAAEIRSPRDTVALRLEQRAAGAAFAREVELRAHYETHRDGEAVRPHRGALKTADIDTDWRTASNDLLFLRKRAGSLAQLLFAKQVFRAVGLKRSPANAVRALFDTPDGRRALDIVLAEHRKAGLSSQVSDVSICGAAHPYNQLLGGKLVAMMLTSTEVRDAYARRYGGQISIIASQMAGRAISKPADLRILTTTSLYGVGSSQYNRLVLRPADDPGLTSDIRWSAIGKSLTGGFGTLHLGNETAHALRSMAFARHDSRRVNNRFGEGTSPRLRQIREGLDALGLKSDAILHHATPRLFFGCELAVGARDSLVGLGADAITAPAAATIAAAWRQRWLDNRSRREDTLTEIARLGPTSVLASLHADADGQFLLPIDQG